jgi:hypothetical protein
VFVSVRPRASPASSSASRRVKSPAESGRPRRAAWPDHKGLKSAEVPLERAAVPERRRLRERRARLRGAAPGTNDAIADHPCRTATEHAGDQSANSRVCAGEPGIVAEHGQVSGPRFGLRRRGGSRRSRSSPLRGRGPPQRRPRSRPYARPDGWRRAAHEPQPDALVS